VPVPVFVVYETAFVNIHGVLQFRPDFYRRDAAIWSQMQRSH
jgi:L,D-transpeptidase YcbB